MRKDLLIIVVTIFLILVALLYSTRFQVVPIGSEDIAAVYKIERLTGKITLLVGTEEIEVKPREKKDIDKTETAVESPKFDLKYVGPLEDSPNKKLKNKGE